MKAKKYVIVKAEVVAMIEFLQDRGAKVGDIRGYLAAYPDLPFRWVKIFSFFENLEESTINISLMKDIHKALNAKVTNLLLYNNKLVKIIDTNEQDFDALLKYYRSTFKKDFVDYSTSELISKADDSLSFKLNFDTEKEAFIVKNIVSDFVKIDIEERVDEELQREFSKIIGMKEVAFPALSAYIFDKQNKTIILSVDLADIVKSSLINMEMNSFSINLKNSISGMNFPPTSLNIFDKIDLFYKEKEGSASQLSLKTPDGVIYHAYANPQYPDARKSQYHKSGALSVKGKVSIYRIQKVFDTKRNTHYSIDLKSIAAMTTKPNPVLYEATIMANNAADFVDAIGRLL